MQYATANSTIRQRQKRQSAEHMLLYKLLAASSRREKFHILTALMGFWRCE